MSLTVRNRTAGKPTITHAAEQFFAYCQQFSQHTQNNYRRQIKAFKRWTGEILISEIRKSDLNTFISSLLAKNSHNTINNAVIPALKSFCAWICDNYDILNPSIGLKYLRNDASPPRCLSPAEYKAVLEVSSDWHRAAFEFIGNTGLRASELMNLKPSNINGKWLTFKGKGGKTRTVPLNDIALSNVETIIHLQKSVKSLDTACKKAAEKAGIPPFGAKAIRHYFATQLLKEKPIHLVSKILGHASTITTEKIYYHFHYSHLEGLTDCLE